MKLLKLFSLIAVMTLTVACSKEEKKRSGIDFKEVEPTLSLTQEQKTRFDKLIADFKSQSEANVKAARAQGDKMDRVALGIKSEALREGLYSDMSKVLDSAQFDTFHAFVEKNSRKRPRYSDKLIADINLELGLNQDQIKVVNAANDAFEKAYHEAHDIYHGNGDLAKEYWERYDNQRKTAIKQVLTPEQAQKFDELVKTQQFQARK